MRIVYTPVLAAIFVGWLIYHLFVKKDIKKQKGNLFAGLSFIAVWVVLFYLIDK